MRLERHVFVCGRNEIEQMLEKGSAKTMSFIGLNLSGAIHKDCRERETHNGEEGLGVVDIGGDGRSQRNELCDR